MTRATLAMAGALEVSETEAESTYVCKHCNQRVAGVKGAAPTTARDFGRATTTTLTEHDTTLGYPCVGSGQRAY